MRIEVLSVMLFWYYGSGSAVADSSRSEGHHAIPDPLCDMLVKGYHNEGPALGPVYLELLAKCLDPTDDMDVYAALLARQSIPSLALPPNKEPDEALEQVFRADHMLGGETNDVSRFSSGAGESDGEHKLQSSDVRVITEGEQTFLGSVDSPAGPEGLEALPGAAEHALLAETTDYFPCQQMHY